MNKFLTNTYKNVAGITIIDSEKGGKNIGIFAITHGNEPVGLDVFNYLVKDFGIKSKLKSGKIFLIAINLKAYKKYINQDDFLEYRFLDNNMNRISNKEFMKGSYEFKRFKELKNIFDEIDIAIDLHSVSSGDDIIGITDEKYLENSKNIFNVENILVDDIGKTGALIGYFLRNNKEAYGIECGNHIGKNAYKNGVQNVLNLFIFHKIFDEKINIGYKNIFKFRKEIFSITDNFKFIKDFVGFCEIKNNEIYAIDKKIEFRNDLGNNIYIGLVSKLIKIGDGVGFLFQKID